MDYEKAYKEALERAKKFANSNYRQERYTAEEIFHELKENEDEKTRKELISYLQELGEWEIGNNVPNPIKSSEYYAPWISWLEKQKPLETPQWMIDFLDEHRRHFGTPMDHDERRDVDGKLLAIVEWLKGNPSIEQKELKIIPRFRVGDLVRSKVNPLFTYKVLEVGIINELGNPDYKVELFKNGKPDILNIEVSKMDKWGELVEQKPADKVEPKFKVGDWIVQENIGVYKVIEICESWYEVIDDKDNHYSIPSSQEYMCHPWTIQDAKDGDVLANDMIVLIVDHLGIFENRPIIYSWYFADSNKFYGVGPSRPDRWEVEGFTPSTKEQRDLLLQKMKEAGYEWDVEKKELKKIKQKPVELSEEDEKIIEGLLKVFRNRLELCTSDMFGDLKIADIISWINKQKGIIEEYEDKLDKCACESWDKGYKEGQKECEWSEEDEERIRQICGDLRCAIINFEAGKNVKGIHFTKIIESNIDWLKSLKPQSHWKPSIEQIRSLDALIEYAPYSSHSEELKQLLEELKTLRDYE